MADAAATPDLSDAMTSNRRSAQRVINEHEATLAFRLNYTDELVTNRVDLSWDQDTINRCAYLPSRIPEGVTAPIASSSKQPAVSMSKAELMKPAPAIRRVDDEIVLARIVFHGEDKQHVILSVNGVGDELVHANTRVYCGALPALQTIATPHLHPLTAFVTAPQSVERDKAMNNAANHRSAHRLTDVCMRVGQWVHVCVRRHPLHFTDLHGFRTFNCSALGWMSLPVDFHPDSLSTIGLYLRDSPDADAHAIWTRAFGVLLADKDVLWDRRPILIDEHGDVEDYKPLSTGDWVQCTVTADPSTGAWIVSQFGPCNTIDHYLRPPMDTVVALELGLDIMTTCMPVVCVGWKKDKDASKPPNPILYNPLLGTIDTSKSTKVMSCFDPFEQVEKDAPDVKDVSGVESDKNAAPPQTKLGVDEYGEIVQVPIDEPSRPSSSLSRTSSPMPPKPPMEWKVIKPEERPSLQPGQCRLLNTYMIKARLVHHPLSRPIYRWHADEFYSERHDLAVMYNETTLDPAHLQTFMDLLDNFYACSKHLLKTANTMVIFPNVQTPIERGPIRFDLSIDHTGAQPFISPSADDVADDGPHPRPTDRAVIAVPNIMYAPGMVTDVKYPMWMTTYMNQADVVANMAVGLLAVCQNLVDFQQYDAQKILHVKQRYSVRSANSK